MFVGVGGPVVASGGESAGLNVGLGVRVGRLAGWLNERCPGVLGRSGRSFENAWGVVVA